MAFSIRLHDSATARPLSNSKGQQERRLTFDFFERILPPHLHGKYRFRISSSDSNWNSFRWLTYRPDIHINRESLIKRLGQGAKRAWKEGTLDRFLACKCLRIYQREVIRSDRLSLEEKRELLAVVRERISEVYYAPSLIEKVKLPPLSKERIRFKEDGCLIRGRREWNAHQKRWVLPRELERARTVAEALKDPKALIIPFLSLCTDFPLSPRQKARIAQRVLEHYADTLRTLRKEGKKSAVFPLTEFPFPTQMKIRKDGSVRIDWIKDAILHRTSFFEGTDERIDLFAKIEESLEKVDQTRRFEEEPQFYLEVAQKALDNYSQFAGKDQTYVQNLGCETRYHVDGHVFIRLDENYFADGAKKQVFRYLHLNTGKVVAGLHLDRENEGLVVEKWVLEKVNGVPHLIKTISAGWSPDKIYLFQPYYEGDLFDAFKERKIEKKDCEPFTEQFLQAVASLHRLKILHRDIKIDNILFRRKKGQFNICLTDFDMAYTNGGVKQWCGTPAYMPPEYLASLGQELSEKTDGWALGKILLTLWCPTSDFYTAEMSDQEIFADLARISRMPPEQAQKELLPEPDDDPTRIFTLIYRLLQVDPKKRFTPVQAQRYFLKQVNIAQIAPPWYEEEEKR